jgi:hypothetical protein
MRLSVEVSLAPTRLDVVTHSDTWRLGGANRGEDARLNETRRCRGIEKSKQ